MQSAPVMTRWLHVLVCLASAAGALRGVSAAESENIETLILRVGSSKVFDATNIASVDQPARNVASTRLVANPPQLIVTGEKVGQATMILWLRNPKGARRTVLIDVVQQLPEEIQKEIKAILESSAYLAGVKTKVISAKVLIYNVPSKAVGEQLRKALKVYEKQIVIMPPGPPKLGEQLRLLLQPWPKVQVIESSPTLVVVRGECPPAAEKRVRALLKEVGANEDGVKIIDLVQVERRRKLIQIRFGFSEMRKEDLSRLGVNWDDRIPITLRGILSFATANHPGPGGVQRTNPFRRVAGTFNGQGLTSFAIIIDAAKVDTVGRIYDEYTVVVNDREQAEYNRKGTIYVEVQGVNTAELKEIDFGAIVKVKPELIGDGKVELNVDATFSSIVPDVTGGQNITVRKNVTKQVVQVELGKSLVLWRTAQHLNRDTIDAVKGLGAVPVLGALFKSKEFIKDKTEGVIWIEPRITSARDERNTKMMTDVYEAIQKSRH